MARVVNEVHRVWVKVEYPEQSSFTDDYEYQEALNRVYNEVEERLREVDGVYDVEFEREV